MLFWLGLAVCVLVPTLFVTVGFGCLVWAWGLAWWLVAQWVYRGIIGGRGGEKGVVVKRENKRSGKNGGREERLVNGENGTWNEEGKGARVEEVEIIVPKFEDVDCVGLMGGGMEL